MRSKKPLSALAREFFAKKLDAIIFKNMSNEEIFTHIYKKNRWKADQTETFELIHSLLEELPSLLKKLEVKSMLDIPCGDFHLLKTIDLGFLEYTGCDIVEHIIQNDIKQYANEKRKFLKLDILKDDLPKADIVFCKDLFIHLPFKDSLKAIKNVKKSGAKYFMVETFPSLKENTDIHTGGWRPFNLNLHPFFFPEPEYRIKIKTITKGLTKEIDLWSVKNLP